jgi:sulfite exporter TauE/SafE
MNEVAVAAALTFAASAHCLGMCGGLMVSVAARGERPGALRDFLLLQLGKGTSYAFLGALAGVLGAALTRSPFFVWTTRGLTLVAAIALASAGFTLMGFGRKAAGGFTAAAAPLWGRLFGPLLQSRPAGFPVVVGLAMGFFPCPLVYAGVAAAAATLSPVKGALTLVGVALGTIPALAMAAGATRAVDGASGIRWRGAMARVAGVVLILTAAVTLSRAVPGAHDQHAGHAAPPSATAPGTAPAEADPHAGHH